MKPALQVCVAFVILTSASAAEGPGGLFESRLKRAQAPPPRKPAPRKPQLHPAPVRKAAAPAPIQRTRPVKSISKPRPLTRVAAAPRPKASDGVSFAVEPSRSAGSSAGLTGDLVLIAQPSTLPIELHWNDEARLGNHAQIRGVLPQTLRVQARVRGTGRTAEAWVPVKADCVTTVRFNLAR